MDKFNAWRLVNLMENEIGKLENATKTNNGMQIKESKQILLSLQKQLQAEIEKQ
jgi:hypothetical protein